MWQSYLNFMRKSKRRPSKYYPEERVLMNWAKHNRKLRNQGKLPDNRKALFAKLVAESAKYQRVNQHQYTNGTAIVELPIHLSASQADMVQRIDEAWVTCRSVMAQMPLYTGEAAVVATLARDFLRRGDTVWVVAMRREQMVLIRRALDELLSNEEMVNIEITNVRRINNLRFPEIDRAPALIVYHDAHRLSDSVCTFLTERYPEAKQLGMTATPWRPGGRGFTESFDLLLTSESIRRFMAAGRLSLYDYYCIRQESEEMAALRSAALSEETGDYDLMALNARWNRENFIARLYEAYEQYAAGLRGMVLAMSVSHAGNVARYYAAKGVAAASVGFQMPASEQERIFRKYRKGELQVLICSDLVTASVVSADVAFVQFARPTRSLALYLQMAERGLRLSKEKDACVFIDNVGLYWDFGLPSDDRDWQRFFNGLGDAPAEVPSVTAAEDELLVKVTDRQEVKESLKSQRPASIFWGRRV